MILNSSKIQTSPEFIQQETAVIARGSSSSLLWLQFVRV